MPTVPAQSLHEVINDLDEQINLCIFLMIFSHKCFRSCVLAREIYVFQLH
jgi:hypothetical protein